MASQSFNGGVKIAIGTMIGAGLALIAYNVVHRNKHNTGREQVKQLDSGITALGWQLKGKSILVAGDTDATRDSITFFLRAGALITLNTTDTNHEVDKFVKEKIQAGELLCSNKPFEITDVLDREWDLVFFSSGGSPDQFIVELVDVCRKKRIPLHLTNHPELSDYWIDTRTTAKTNQTKQGQLKNKSLSVTVCSEPVQEIAEGEAQPQTSSLHHIPANTTAVELEVEQNSSDTHPVLFGIFDGYAVARYVGSGFADVFYDFSFAEEPSSHFERFIGNPQSPILNIFGKQVKVLLMDVRSGAGGALYGTLTAPANKPKADSKQQENGIRGHAIIPSSGLIEMAPILHQLAHEKVPCVIHSAVAHIDEDLTITPDLSDILSIQYTGVNIVNSTTAQEAHDLAIISHIASQILSEPFVHFFDLKTTARTATTVNILSRDQIKQLLESSLSNVVENKDDSKIKRVSNVIDFVMEHARQALGKRYEIFEYNGSPEAEVLFVSVGDASLVIRDTVEALAATCKVGAVTVRVLRPWDARRFVNLVPPSVKKLVVCGPFFAEIAASFHVAACKGTYILKVENASTFVMTPSIVCSVYEHALSSPSPSHVTLPLPTKEAVSGSLQLPQRSSVIGEIWEEPGEDIAVNVSSLLAQTKLRVAATTNIGLLSPDSPEQSQVPRVKSTVFQLSNGSLSSIDRENPVDFLIVYDIALLKKVNVFANLKPSGTLVLQWPYGVEELEEKLPSATKREIAGKRLKFFIFPTTTGKSKLPVQLAAFFFAVSGLLPELDGWHTLSDTLRSVKRAYISQFLQNVETLARSLPIPTPSGWLDAAENQDLLPAPKARIIPKKVFKKLVSPVETSQEVIKYLMFPEAYSTSEKLRPDIQGAHLVKVTVNRRLTPIDYERNVFHIEFDTTGTELKYEIGEALAVYGHNDATEVETFLKFYGLNPNQLVALPFKGSKPGQVHIKTVEHIFTQYIDLFGRPSKEFYVQLAEYATDPKEKDALIFLTTPDGQAEYKKRVDHTITFEDILVEFPSAHPSLEKLLELIPPIKPRHYSISSSMKMHPTSVHLLVVLVGWDTPKKARYGHCTRYLSGLKPGDIATVSVKPSVMMLPPLPTQPIVMAGLGTGMAPFRAFLQERAVLKAQGVEVGPAALYFGSRSRFAEYLYGEELEAYSKEGLLTYLRLAFSRDQAEKIYIQHKINEDKSIMWKLLVAQKGHFYLCGPTWPEADVRDALLSSFELEGNLCKTDAEGLLEKIRVDERYILELY